MEEQRGLVRYDRAVADAYGRTGKIVVSASGQLWDAIQAPSRSFELTASEHDWEAGGINACICRGCGRDEAVVIGRDSD